MVADSDAYRLLERWVSEGAGWGRSSAPRLVRIEVFPAEARVRPGQSQQLAVSALYEDGTAKDVTRVAELRTNDSSLVEIDEAGLVTAEVVSARELDANEEERLRRALSAATGREVRLDIQLDPGVIGGVIAKVGDLVFDGTLRAHLGQLRATMTKGS